MLLSVKYFQAFLSHYNPSYQACYLPNEQTVSKSLKKLQHKT